MGRIIVGVDPGLSGAIAILVTDAPDKLAVFDMPTIVGEVNAAALAEILRPYAPDLAVIERVAARPGQGVSSMFRFGQAFGTAVGVLGGRGIRLEFVPSTKWKRHFRLGGGEEGKEQSRAAALNHWPQRAELFKRKMDHGRAEAALIALYGADTL